MADFRILLVDDDDRIRRFLGSKLKASGFQVLDASTGAESLELAKAGKADLMVLDLIMPGMDGLETLERLRKFSEMPVIILSGKGRDSDKIGGLRLGADDYLEKPFNADELVARIEALRRRLQGGRVKGAELVTLDGVEIDFRKRKLVVRGEEKYLTRIEWLLLAELVANMGHVVTYQHLLSQIWGAMYKDDVHIVRTWVSRLRKQIELDPEKPELIRTILKVGYIIGSEKENEKVGQEAGSGIGR